MTLDEMVHRRRSLGLTQADLAAAIGKSTSTIDVIERGLRAVRPDEAAALAPLLGCIPSDIPDGRPIREPDDVDAAVLGRTKDSHGITLLAGPPARGVPFCSVFRPGSREWARRLDAIGRRLRREADLAGDVDDDFSPEGLD